MRHCDKNSNSEVEKILEPQKVDSSVMRSAINFLEVNLALNFFQNIFGLASSFFFQLIFTIYKIPTTALLHSDLIASSEFVRASAV